MGGRMTQDEIIEMATKVYGECDWLFYMGNKPIRRRTHDTR
jgi:hypothetical protein